MTNPEGRSQTVEAGTMRTKYWEEMSTEEKLDAIWESLHSLGSRTLLMADIYERLEQHTHAELGGRPLAPIRDEWNRPNYNVHNFAPTRQPKRP